MNKLKRNGFTLIELLAVIVILAIIALIAVPVVMNIIEKAKKSAFKNSAYGILKAGELYYSEQEMSLNVIEEDKVFEFPNNIDTLKLKGDIPQGMMVITKEGKMALAITNGKYCITKNYDEDIKLLENVSRCAIPYTLAAVATTSEELGVTKVDECIKRGTLCDFGADVEEPTSFAIEVNDTDLYKFYVINDNGEEVTLIMDRNLYSKDNSADGDVPWISANDYGSSDVYNDKGPITALNELEKRTNTWYNILQRKYIIIDDSFRRDYEIIKIMRARMLTYTEANNLGCTSTVGSCPKYLYINLQGTGDNLTTGYWLSTTDKQFSWKAQGIDSRGYFYPASADLAGMQGIRPVIIISK